ncbi:MAG: GNAT family N-acetyltransferase [Asgard group archaeon]|nr:GNAT family N-acetyltransferase [Asgard group archaeon]
MIDFVTIKTDQDKTAFVKLNIEYFEWVWDQFIESFNTDVIPLIGTPEEYVENNKEEFFSYFPPKGICYLIRDGDNYIGMGALRKIKEGICEIKRMYVKSSYRGKGLGKSLLDKLTDDAKNFGFSKIYLDVGPYNIAAQGLYKKFGFIQREPYPETEAPKEFLEHWTFMEKEI